MRRRIALGVSTLVALVALGTDARATSSSALELVRSARAAESGGDEPRALRRYTEAIGLDATCEEAYLGLAALRARRGDLREAERVYSVALAHVPQSRVALVERARVRFRLGLREEAVRDVEVVAQEDPTVLRDLSVWYGEHGLAPAQLAVWRRLLAHAHATSNEALLVEARAMVRALQILLEHADPVTAPSPPSPVRRLARDVARRGG